MGNAIVWYTWNSLKSFEIWHDDTCALLGLPKPGKNVATGEIDTDAQWTTRYTYPVIVNKNDVRAFVEEDVASFSPNFLGMPSEKPETASDIID